ncbi:hypothetical protein Pla175_24010 [Pirellulimonas nuda]|uniref:Uncharacterized protein n=1 Tax=Pirellulimonas nuda TaxID=2528009 RepID=A0A518DC58_9BACT|nr:hypothetical protein [Pirellulimonas nuda]QDU89016.1 hypothetical protein Pla175_24010 [Pirellulimonas nuda]
MSSFQGLWWVASPRTAEAASSGCSLPAAGYLRRTHAATAMPPTSRSNELGSGTAESPTLAALPKRSRQKV